MYCNMNKDFLAAGHSRFMLPKDNEIEDMSIEQESLMK